MLLIMDETSVKPSNTSSDDDDLDHIYCECDENISLCGIDLTGVEEIDKDAETPDDCVVCIDLRDRPCQRCGG